MLADSPVSDSPASVIQVDDKGIVAEGAECLVVVAVKVTCQQPGWKAVHNVCVCVCVVCVLCVHVVCAHVCFVLQCSSPCPVPHGQ